MAQLSGSNEEQLFFDEYGRKVEEEFNALNPTPIEDADPDGVTDRHRGEATTLIQDALAPYIALFQKDMFKAGTKTAQEGEAPTGVMGISDVPEFDPVTVAKMASLFTAMAFPIFDATARSVESAIGEGAKVDVAETVPGSAGTKEEASKAKVDPRGRVGATAGMVIGGVTEAIARGIARGVGAVALRRAARRSVQAKLAGMSDAEIAKNIELAMRMQEIAEIPGLPEEVFSRAQITPSDAVTRVKGAPILNMNVPDRGVHLTMEAREGELVLGGMSHDPGIKGGADDAILAAMGHAEKHGFTEVVLETPARIVDRLDADGLITRTVSEGGLFHSPQTATEPLH
ncbi:hypothetical protein LCGC14_2029980, partial [marine sediment metagenome]